MALLGEMRRRNIFKVSLAYAIVSWLIVQIADVLLPTFNVPQWIMQALVLVLILLFPIAVLLSWAFELTPQGFKPTADVDRTQSITIQTGRRLNYAVTLLLSVAVVFLVLDNYFFREEVVPDPDVAYRQSLAVLPFQNRSAAEENAEFFADGIHGELLNRLAQITDLRIISRTSVMEYRDTTRNLVEIGEQLGVGSILEGAVQRAGDDVRINVQLVDARTDEPIWADSFDRELNVENLFAIQSEIATAIADALEANLSDLEQERLETVPTRSLAALEHYFFGQRLLGERTVESLRGAIRDFEAAVATDPEFAAAWAGIAEAWLELPTYAADAESSDTRRRASSAVIRALSLDPASPDVLAVVGWYLLLHDFDWAGAERAFRQALSINSTHVNALHWYSHLLSWQGKPDDAITSARLAVSADPLSILARTNLNYVLLDARRWDEAVPMIDSITDEAPYLSLQRNNWIGFLRARRGQEAANLLVSWAGNDGRDIEAAAALGALFVQALDAGESGEIDSELLTRLEIRAEAAEVYAALGDADNTILALQAASRTASGFRSLLSMKINPSYDFVRDDPRFVELTRLVGLAD
jgi:TolB-like protein/Tfp pilus assembly protein PilF